MILVDVEVPVLEKVYDVQLDENTVIAFLLEDLAGMICQKEQLVQSGDLADLSLWSKYTKQQLMPHKTLKDYSIASGQTLILV